MKNWVKLLTTVALFAFVQAHAQTSGAADTSANPVSYNMADIKWMDAPPLPKGAKMAVLAGNPNEAGPFTLRIKFPANFEVKPHRHANGEQVTVIQGVLYCGAGEQFDRSKATLELRPGGFAAIPGPVAHYAYTKEEVIIQVNGVGPFDVTYLNASDDPRKGSGNQ